MSSTNRKLKAAVAMSGGVDSSVAAALLKKQGYQVTGFFMHFWSEKTSQPAAENKCCSIESQEQARDVARKLNIPFYVLHFEKEFKKYVVDYFIRNYGQGITPNPCIACNKHIKFDFLLNKILGLDFDYLATGHYVKKLKVKGSGYKLLKAEDKNKDQSYFLYNLGQKQLKSLLFPVGNYKKEETRELAKKFCLPTATRRESQDICFVSGNDVGGFLSRHLQNAKPGPIINTKDKTIGTHSGLPLYTIGQRKGIKIGGQGPYYVVNMDYQNNILVVTSAKDDEQLYSKSLKCETINWVSGLEPQVELTAEAVIRYQHPPVKALIKRQADGYQVGLAEPQRAVMPGQSAVFYKGDELLGGGVIKDISN